jgi:hypothetical protein
MKTKYLTRVTALMVGGFLSTSALAASVDEVTMEVVDVDTQQTSDVTRQMEIPQALQTQEQYRTRERHEYRKHDSESESGDMLREQARDRSELRDDQQSQTRDQIRDNADAVKQQSQDQLQDAQEVKQQLHQGMK